MRNKTFLLSFIFLIIAVSCATRSESNTNFSFPDFNFTVVSDIHYYPDSFHNDGLAIKEAIEFTPNLYELSTLIFDQFIIDSNQFDSDFIIITGDLTARGEKEGHLELAEKLSAIEEDGREVYLIPGNHDVNSVDSVYLIDDEPMAAENITEEDFESIYNNFGFNQALERDESSLSYVVEPIEGLWLIALDGLHEEPLRSQYKNETIDWLEEVLIKSNSLGKSVILFSHYPLGNHYYNQQKYEKFFVIQKSFKIQRLLTKYGVQVHFSGHGHAQDVVELKNIYGSIYDIQTGSLVTWPSPFRNISVRMNQMELNSEYISELTEHEVIYEDWESFSKYSYTRCYSAVYNFITSYVQNYYVDELSAEVIGDLTAASYLAYTGGDEDPSLHTDSSEVQLYGDMARIVIKIKGNMLDRRWYDLEPEDNDLVIFLH